MTDTQPATDSTDTTDTETKDTEQFTSDLHPKHQQSLLDAYDKATWLCRTLDDSLYISVPSHLTNIKHSLESVLTDNGLLEHQYHCEQCRYTDWRTASRHDRVPCPNCETDLERGNTRHKTSN